MEWCDCRYWTNLQIVQLLQFTPALGPLLQPSLPVIAVSFAAKPTLPLKGPPTILPSLVGLDSTAAQTMRNLAATFCLALALAGCRGTGSGMFGHTTIPPPGTQPPGTLLADNSYYPAATSSSGSTLFGTTPLATPNLISPPGFPAPAATQLPTPQGATISRSNLGTPSRTLANPPREAREQPIRIPDDNAVVGALAAVVPIRGIPTTDTSSLFDTVRTQAAASRGFLAARSAPASGFVEISQLPDAPAELRRAALSGQSLR